MGDYIAPIVGICTAIVTLAIIAVLVSKNSQTSTVVQAFGSAFSSAIQEAVSPISGSTASS